MKQWNSERGLSLPEVLATFTIMSIIGLILFGILFSGIKTYDRVKAEEMLRDEADIIIAHLIRDFYTVKESEITEKHLHANDSISYYIELDGNRVLGFVNGEVYTTNGNLSVLQEDDMTLTKETNIIETAKGHFKITLGLKHLNTNKKLTTVTEVSIVTDS